MNSTWIGREVLGRYRIVSDLGKGAMSVVYLAEQPIGNTTRNVAVKAMKRELSESAQFVDRFHREAVLMTELRHPNTIKILDSGTLDDGTLVIVMEYIDGEPLNERLERGIFKPAQVDRILLQLCGALNEAHERGIAHRDLKPENILLERHLHRDDFVKLMDFGIASDIDDAEAVAQSVGGRWMGTPPYMSPEQFAGGHVDRRSDIYSLGVICYELLTRKLPFEADNSQAWLLAHTALPPKPILEYRPNLHHRKARAIMRALSKSPDERHSDVLAFLREFTGYQDALEASDQLQSGVDIEPTTSLFPALPALDSKKRATSEPAKVVKAPALQVPNLTPSAPLAALSEQGESAFKPGMSLDFELDVPSAGVEAQGPLASVVVSGSSEAAQPRHETMKESPEASVLSAHAQTESRPAPTSHVDMTQAGWDKDILDLDAPEPTRKPVVQPAASAAVREAPKKEPKIPKKVLVYGAIAFAVLLIGSIFWMAQGDDVEMSMARSNYKKSYHAALKDLKLRRDDDAWRQSVEGRVTAEKVLEGARKQIRSSFANGRCGFAQAAYIEVSVEEVQEQLRNEFTEACPAPSF